MTSNEIEVVQSFIAAINRQSPADIAELMTEDHAFVDSSGRAVSGRQQMTAGWSAYFGMFPDFTIEVETILSDGELGPVPENRIEMPAAWRAIVRDGKVQRWQVYADWTDGTRRIAEDGAAG